MPNRQFPCKKNLHRSVPFFCAGGHAGAVAVVDALKTVAGVSVLSLVESEVLLVLFSFALSVEAAEDA